MNRFFADHMGLQGDAANLEPTDAHHALKVLRLGVGDRVVLIANGCLYESEISDTKNDKVRVLIQKSLASPEPVHRITLYQGMPKADKMDLIVQKATELGVHKIVPVTMKYCISKAGAKDGQKKQERWQKIAREAAKQSGRAFVPEVAMPSRVKAGLSAHDVYLVPWEKSRGFSIKQAYTQNPDALSIGLLIGPEGGISDEEIHQLPFIPVTLGPRILRTETAGICALSILYSLYGDMD